MNIASFSPNINPVGILGQRASQFAVEQASVIAAHPEITVLTAIALFSVGAVAYKYFQGGEQVSSGAVEEEPVIESNNEESVQVYEEDGHQLTVRTSPGFCSYEYEGNGATIPPDMAKIIQMAQSLFEQMSLDLDLFFPPIPYPVFVLNG